MFAYIFYGIAIVCLLAFVQARKDFIRAVGCLGLAAIFGFIGFAIQANS